MASEYPIHFLDLGAGQNPDRTKALALRHPNKRVTAVDMKPLGDHEKIPDNMTYVESGVLSYLRTLENNTVQIANADFLLNEMSDKEITELAGHIKRALTPNGRFYISEDRQNIADIRFILHQQGFKTEVRDITPAEAEKPKTWFTQVRIEHPQH